MSKLVVLGTDVVRVDDDDVLIIVDKPATYGAPAGADVGEASGEVLAANTVRRVAVVVNDSDAVVYLAVGTDAVLNSGIRLNPQGGSVQFGGPGGLPLTTQAINGIHGSTGNKRVTVQEAV